MVLLKCWFPARRAPEWTWPALAALALLVALQAAVAGAQADAPSRWREDRPAEPWAAGGGVGFDGRGGLGGNVGGAGAAWPNLRDRPNWISSALSGGGGGGYSGAGVPDGVLNPFDAYYLGYPGAQEALPSPLVGAGLYQPPKVPVAPLPTWQNPRPPPVALGGTSPVRPPPLRPGALASLGSSPATQPAPPPVFYPRPHAGVDASALQRVSKALLGVPSYGHKAAAPVGASTQDEVLLSQVMDGYGDPIFIGFDMPHYNEDDSGPHYTGH